MENDSEIAAVADARSEPKFRALTVNGSRRGIRLEQLYWDVLARIATERGVKLGQLIHACEEAMPDGANVTAGLRVLALAHLEAQSARQTSETPGRQITGLVAGCPSPAIALSADRKILSYNQALLGYLQARLTSVPAEALAKDFRLVIDTPFAGLIERLKARPEAPIVSGFSITTGGQVFRGRMNVTLGGTERQPAVIGYILP